MKLHAAVLIMLSVGSLHAFAVQMPVKASKDDAGQSTKTVERETATKTDSMTDAEKRSKRAKAARLPAKINLNIGDETAK